MTAREMLREVVTDEVGKANQDLEAHLGARFVALEKSVNGRVSELATQVGQALDRLEVIETDVRSIRAQLAGIARVDLQRRVDKLEARLDALEEARQ